jgi:dTDP-4-dehydrorhamnose reductase
MLITGVRGLLGNNLAYYFKQKYEILGLYSSHPVLIAGVRTEKCDLLCHDSIGKVVEEFDPMVIIHCAHCASLANVDQCENDPEMSELLNVQITKNSWISSGNRKPILSTFLRIPSTTA